MGTNNRIPRNGKPYYSLGIETSFSISCNTTTIQFPAFLCALTRLGVLFASIYGTRWKAAEIMPKL